MSSTTLHSLTKMSTKNGSEETKVEIRDVTTPTRFDNKATLSRNQTQAVTYFTGSRDIQRHSKLPMFLRMKGGVLPHMTLPFIFIGSWASAVMIIDKKVCNIGVDSVLLTGLAFVIAFSLNFRSATAYERYSEGRKYWAQLVLTSRNLGRHIWINMAEREDPEDPTKVKKDLLGKITAMNLIHAFSVALVHRLRFEPAVDYPDLEHLVAHLTTTTLAGRADQSKLKAQEPSTMKRLGAYLGLSFAQSNPRKVIKRSEENLGNLPHEILVHLSSYLETAMATKQIYGPNKFFWSDVRTMSEILTGVERILNTPLPLAYTISMSQIIWLYILALPFQLANRLGWITIPATMIAAYIILGIAMIGHEIENPFGNDVNDLPLEAYCNEIRDDLDMIMGHTLQEYGAYTESSANRPLYPLNWNTTNEWLSKDMSEVRALLRTKAARVQPRKRTGAVSFEEV